MHGEAYRCILADPPWPEYGGGKSKRGADRHYRLLSPKKIAEAMRQAVFFPTPCAWRPNPAGCHLWLWSTNNFLPPALWVMEQLGFRYVTNVVWAKMQRERAVRAPTLYGEGWVPQRPGLGQYLRGQHELLLFGVRGRLPAVQKGSTLLPAARRRHSQKPEEAYELIERVSPGPRLEMFARGKREGWDVWGNEV